jgi:hypothetical protein
MTVGLRPPAAALRAMFRRRLDKQVTIQRPALVNGVQQYQDWITVPAAMEPGSGVEAASGSLDPTNVAAFQVFIEFVAGIQLSYQFAFEGRLLGIISVTNLAEADLFLLFICKEVQV